MLDRRAGQVSMEDWVKYLTSIDHSSRLIAVYHSHNHKSTPTVCQGPDRDSLLQHHLQSNWSVILLCDQIHPEDVVNLGYDGMRGSGSFEDIEIRGIEMCWIYYLSLKRDTIT